MDYKYIEQLLERYWQCETTLEEEAILKAFFSQAHIPAHLQHYQGLFACEKRLQDARLSEDFEARILARTENANTVKARKINAARRLMPLYKAVASIAIVFMLGSVAQNAFHSPTAANDDYNYENYQDSYNDPQMAYDQVTDALQMVSQSLNEASKQDSLLQTQIEDRQKEQ